MRDKVIILFGVMNIMFSCEKHISSLEQKELKYDQLPKLVKERMFNLYGDFSEEEQDRMEYKHTFRELNIPAKYEFYTKQEFFFRWIYNGYIKSKKTGKIYSLKKEIDVERGYPRIIYKDSLYIPNHYNIYEEDSLSYTFTRFILE